MTSPRLGQLCWSIASYGLWLFPFYSEHLQLTIIIRTIFRTLRPRRQDLRDILLVSAPALSSMSIQYQDGSQLLLTALPTQAYPTDHVSEPPTVAGQHAPPWSEPHAKTHCITEHEDTLPADILETIDQNRHIHALELPTTLVNAPTIGQTVDKAEMKQVKTKCTIGLLSTLIAYVSLNSLLKTLRPGLFVWCDEDRENEKWVATSTSWFDRRACRWLGICGGQHMHFARDPFGGPTPLAQDPDKTDDFDWKGEWVEGIVSSRYDEEKRRKIPDYVMEYAPLVYLFSKEQFWPCDIAEHLYHTTPFLNYTPIQSEDHHSTLSDLNELNKYQDGDYVFLTSNDDVETRPEWLEGAKNIPKEMNTEDAQPNDDDNDYDDDWEYFPPRTHVQGIQDAARVLGDKPDDDIGMDDPDLSKVATSDETAQLLQSEAKALLQQELKRRSAESVPHPDDYKPRGGRSSAPAILITVPKPDGVVDAFWFFFYSFNLGNSVFNVRFGNHVGDWEHTAVRFKNGKPKAVYFSEHSFGSAYAYEAVEKIGKRPVIYSATGTHAMYATPGLHPYILPGGLLHDETDRGPLWDPALNHHSYTYDYQTEDLQASNLTPQSPTSWFHFAGHWGDKFYELSDKRQYRFAGQYHYVNGPLGPKFKNLGRKEICGGPDGTPCAIKLWLGHGLKISRSAGNGEEADSFSAAHKAKLKFDLR